MANSYYYSNTAQETTLSGSISAGATSITVAATTGFPSSFPYVVAIDYGASAEELASVTSAAGTTLTVTRGFGGTSAQTHSLGAKVRHVYNAQDASDFRTHEAATAAVHGVTGTLVGTSDTQTLANKTLTSPTVNGPTITSPTVTGGGSLAGTFSGTPTFSGAVVLSGTPSISNGAALAGTFTGAPTFSGNVTHTGEILLSNLLRGSRALSTDTQYETRVTGDTNARWFVDAAGKQWWSSGAVAPDVNFYRGSANLLKTDDDFSAANFPNGAWTAWTPTWTTSTGLNVPSLGNAALDCAYTKIGRTVFFRFEIVFGSTTNFGGGGTNDNYRFGIPSAAAATHSEIGFAELNASTTNRVVARMRLTTTTAFELEISSGAPDGAALANNGLVDNLTPWAWGSGNAIRGTGFYEAAS